MLTTRSLFVRSADVLARPGLAERVMSLDPPEPSPGPSRDELVGYWIPLDTPDELTALLLDFLPPPG